MSDPAAPVTQGAPGASPFATPDPDRPPHAALLWGAALSIGALALLFGLRLIEDQDILWHVLTGRWVLEHGIPYHDPFGSVTQGWPWLCVSWGADTVWALLERALRIEGVQVLMALVPAALAAVLILRRREPGVIAGALLFVLATWSRFLPRPDVLSAPLTVALAAILLHEGWPVRRRAAALFVLGALWCNVHGSFLLVPLAACAWAAGRFFGRRDGFRAEAGWIAGSALAGTFLNPWGPALYRLFTPYLRSLAAAVGAAPADRPLNIQEWEPTWRTLRQVQFPTLAFFALGLLALVRIVKGPAASRLPRLLLWLLFLVLALTAVRHVLPFGAAMLALIAFPGTSPAGQDDGWRPAFGPALRRAEALVCIALALFTGFRIVRGDFYFGRNLPSRTGVGLHPDLMAHDLGAWMRAHKLPGAVFNNFDSGSYLLWATGGEFAPFLDNRVVSSSFLLECTEAVSDPHAFMFLEREHGIQAIVLNHPSAETMGMLPWILDDESWRPVYVEPDGTVFVKDGAQVETRAAGLAAPAPAPGWARGLNGGFDRMRRRALPVADLNAGLLYTMVGDRKNAVAAFQRVLESDPDNAFARQMLGALPPETRLPTAPVHPQGAGESEEKP